MAFAWLSEQARLFLDLRFREIGARIPPCRQACRSKKANTKNYIQKDNCNEVQNYLGMKVWKRPEAFPFPFLLARLPR
jgi:hypothetical protein